ncbi:MAG: T9SS type A sorting domain-containing protein [bacterium]
MRNFHPRGVAESPLVRAWLPAIAVLAAVALVAAPARAQLGFTEFALTDTTLNSSPDTDFWIASAAPADVDADGDLDLLVAGYYVVYFGSVEDRLTLYRNDGPADAATWALTPVPLDATDLYLSSADLAWGDYDNDGDPDVAVASRFNTCLFRNDGGALVRTSTVLPAYEEDNGFTEMDLHSLSWADVDNDGDLDLLVPSAIDASSFDRLPAALLRNDGPGAGDAWTFTDVGAGLPIAPNAVSAFGDLEGDGDMDLFLTNVSPYGDNFMTTWRNDAGTFSPADTGLAFIRYGMADWGDMDNDGDLDIVYGGNMDVGGFGETVVRILRRDGPGTYTPIDVVHEFQSVDEPWLDFSAVTWADYDSDGDADLLVSGEWLGNGEIFGRAMVYVNQNGTFAAGSEPLPAPIAGNAGGAFTWFDVDGDGDLDYFVAGAYYVPDGNGLLEARTQLFRNDATAPNAAPSVPGGLRAVASAGGVALAWNAASDDRTPAAALTYDLQVVPLGAPAGPGRALPQPGSVGGNKSWTLRGLEPGQYAWSVRTLDNAFNASTPAHGTFSIGGVGVALPASPPPRWALSAPRPNPFAAESRVTLAVDREQVVHVSVYDVLGRRVAVLHDGPLATGPHSFLLDGRGLPSGTYFIRAKGEDRSDVRRVTLLR